MPEWGNVDGTLPGRISKMELEPVIERYVSEDDLVAEIGSAEGYTSTEMANLSGAKVVGVDMPEVFSQGVSENRYGEGPKPEYVAGVAPFLPFQDDSFDVVAGLNSVTYLSRNIGSLASDPHDDATEEQHERLEQLYTASFVRGLLDEFDRITDDGTVILGGADRQQLPGAGGHRRFLESRGL